MGVALKALGLVKKKASAIKQKRLANVTTRIIVGTATCGVSAGAREVVQALDQEVKSRNLKSTVVTETGCSGRCDLEPLVQVIREGEPPIMYYRIDAEKAKRIVQQHVQNGEVIVDWTLT